MIQLGEPLNRKKTIKCQSCGDRILYVLHDRKAGDRLRFQDVRFLQASKTTVRNPLYCAKCDEPWINKSTGRLISQLTAQIKKLHSRKKDNRVFGLYIKKTDADILKMDSKRDSNQTIVVGKKSNAPSAFKYFKPMIDDCKASKIKTSDLMPGSKINFNDLIDKKITGPGIPEMLKAEKVNKNKICINPVVKMNIKEVKKRFFKPIKKLTGYKADSIIVDECKPLTRRQIKESNDALNKLNAKKPTKKRGSK